ncbi:hypothetical protein Dda_2373 [Drechslerella dactyloides]|uniref:Uncharacterized protein n=1 Tax=Drechslerella dactyloides TaxID=74499 RepID=A0AAD6NLG2_DREDA|nr:hypothetical protein Dda_2373 [Drechslerella dactyloides]
MIKFFNLVVSLGEPPSELSSPLSATTAPAPSFSSPSSSCSPFSFFAGFFVLLGAAAVVSRLTCSARAKVTVRGTTSVRNSRLSKRATALARSLYWMFLRGFFSMRVMRWAVCDEGFGGDGDEEGGGWGAGVDVWVQLDDFANAGDCSFHIIEVPSHSSFFLRGIGFVLYGIATAETTIEVRNVISSSSSSSSSS